MKQDIQVLFDQDAEHGEGPVWDPDAKKLYWVDILQNRYFSGSLVTGKVDEFNVGQPIGVLALKKRGGVIVGLRDGFAHFDEFSGKVELIYNTVQANPGTRFNDGAVDPKGRFLAGIMTFDGDEPVGKMFSLNFDYQVYEFEPHMYIPNGMGWSGTGDTFYLTDTIRHVIYAYDYDLETGKVSNRRDFITFEKNEFPDGCCIDAEGDFWVAMWGGGCLLRFDKNGKRKQKIELPVSHPTSCCFAGKDLNTLMITTSRLLLTPDQVAACPEAGKVLAMETDAVGKPDFKFNGQ